ncbi:MAG: DUF427 domain-containing protein [Planctomycetota bacterium]
MPKATWNDQVIAESDDTEIVDGNHYFPPTSINSEFFRDSDHSSVCGCKGTASYFDVVVGDKTNKDAAWYYPDPKDEVQQIKGYVAFWKGVEVTS